MLPSEFDEAVRAYCGWSRASETSGLRSPERNALVGGHQDSSHLLGIARDVVYAPNPRPPLARAKRRATRLGMKLIREDSHDHLQAL